MEFKRCYTIPENLRGNGISINFLHRTSVYSTVMIWMKAMCTIYMRYARVIVHTFRWRHVCRVQCDRCYFSFNVGRFSIKETKCESLKQIAIGLFRFVDHMPQKNIHTVTEPDYQWSYPCGVNVRIKRCSTPSVMLQTT